MGSTLLFHGPSSEASARTMSVSLGAVIEYSGKAMKMDLAREVVSVIQFPPGLRPVSVLINEIDAVDRPAMDVLLKSLEEPNERVSVVLWARDVGAVPETIISRCFTTWCDDGGDPPDEDCSKASDKCFKAICKSDLPGFLDALSEFQGGVSELVLHIMSSSEKASGAYNTPLWAYLRNLLQHRDPTTNELVCAVMGYLRVIDGKQDILGTWE